ncbi:MAG: hypothetical protein V2A54_06095 [Bacteroidota bacterium]
MNKTLRSTIFWILAFLLTAASAIYQRMTGPTYPVNAQVKIENAEVKAKLLTSSDNDLDPELIVKSSDPSMKAKIRYKRFKSNDEWTERNMKQMGGGELSFYLPKQPAAGKLMYQITLIKGEKEALLTEEPVVIRFKGPVPSWVLIPHIIFMFLAMFLSMRTGIQALANGQSLLAYTKWVMIFLLLGGLILGPVIQKYAFGAYWTGWPLGHDLTDNKTIVAFLFWVIAYFRLRKNPNGRWWPLIAAFVTLAIYLIPHSVLGSEIDYTKAK